MNTHAYCTYIEAIGGDFVSIRLHQVRCSVRIPSYSCYMSTAVDKELLEAATLSLQAQEKLTAVLHRKLKTNEDVSSREGTHKKHNSCLLKIFFCSSL